MNKQSLDERIEEYVDSHQYIDGDLRPVPYDEIYPEFKQLIRDVIQEVLPEKTSLDIEDMDAHEWRDYVDRQVYSLADLDDKHDSVIDTINSNLDSLLTGEKQ